MEITIIETIEDAATSHRVTIVRAKNEDRLFEAAKKAIDELIDGAIDERDMDISDDRITVGAEINGRWTAFDTSKDGIDVHRWRSGYFEFRIRECGDEYTLRAYGDKNSSNPILTEVEA